jgi:hypothetical protein
MKRQAFGLVLLTLSQAIAFSQSGPPKQAIDITDADVKEVLKHAPPAVDQQLRVVDMGRSILRSASFTAVNRPIGRITWIT